MKRHINPLLVFAAAIWLVVMDTRVGVHIYPIETKIIVGLAFAAFYVLIWNKLAIPTDFWSAPTIGALALIWVSALLEGILTGLVCPEGWFWPTMIATLIATPVGCWLFFGNESAANPQQIVQPSRQVVRPDDPTEIAFSTDPFEGVPRGFR